MGWRLAAAVAGALLVLALLGSAFTVNESEWALRTRFGAVQAQAYAPGLHWSWPFEHIVRIERRIVTQNLQGESFLSREQQGLVVDLTLLWRVQDPLAVLRTSGADEQMVDERLADDLRSTLKAAYAQLPLEQIIALPDGGLSGTPFARLQARARELGVQILDARVQRIDTSDELAGAIFKRMQAGYAAQAAKTRAEGGAEADRIRAQAERNRGELLATANRDAQRVRGEGDAQAAAIYARSYGRNAEFAAFYRSLQAYRAVLVREGDLLVIEPEGDFYKYLRNASGH